jgi:hypothetical protein
VMRPPSSGPSTLHTANTATIAPWRRPRCAGGTRSPMMICESGSKPPAPSPWTARNRMSCSRLCAAPLSAEPIRKITMAA